MIFANNLRKYRRLRGYTQERLSQKSGVSVSSIVKIEKHRINPTLVDLYTFSSILKCNPFDLFTFEQKPEAIDFDVNLIDVLRSEKLKLTDLPTDEEFYAIYGDRNEKNNKKDI